MVSNTIFRQDTKDLKDALLADSLKVSYCRAGGAVKDLHYQDVVLHCIPTLQPKDSV